MKPCSEISHPFGDVSEKYPLYFITDPLYGDPLIAVRQALRGGVKLVQYRDKLASRRQVYETALHIREVTRAYDATLIINDDVDIAMAVGADGVHLGQEDFPLLEARRLLGTAIIGVSTHDLDEARQAESEGADYIGVGPVFTTSTKTTRLPIGLSTLEGVARHIKIPLYAIGGIGFKDIPDILATGATGIAAISGLSGPIEENVTQWLTALRCGNKAGDRG